MRKVLSFVLVLTLVLSSFSMAFAADAVTTAAGLTDISASANSQAIEVANNLGIVTGNPDGTFQPEKAVNRAEFAAMITRALGIPDSALKGYTATSFKDTTGYTWAVPYLAFCQSKGIMLGDGAGNAMPGRTINTNEAATMILRALGYTSNSSALVGVWPSNYVSMAQDLGIYDDTAAATNVDKQNAAQMIYNALSVQKVQVAADGTTTQLVDKNNVAVTMLTSGLGCEDEGHAIVTYDAEAVISTIPHVGEYAKTYTNSDGDLIAIDDVQSTAYTGTFDDVDASGTFSLNDTFTVDDVDYTLQTLTYDDDENSATAQVPFLTFKNGDNAAVVVTDGDTYTFNVRLTNKKTAEIFSIEQWTVDAAAKVVAGDLNSIADGSLLGFDFATDKNDKIIAKTFELVGAASLADIKADSVVYVYEDATRDEISKVTVGTAVVEGKVTKVNPTDSEWTVGGKVYAFGLNGTNGSSAYKNELNNDVKLYLDQAGDIYKYEVTSGSAKEYATVVTYDIGGTADGNMKLYLADDSKKTFSTDLDTFATFENVIDVAGGGDANLVDYGRRLIGYSLDKDGVIDGTYPDVDNVGAVTWGDNAKDGWYRANAGAAVMPGNTSIQNMTQVAGKTVLVGPQNLVVDESAVVYTYDTAVANGTKATINGVAKVADIEKDPLVALTGQVEALVRDGKVVAMIVFADDCSGSATDSYAVISGASQAVNSAGDKALVLEGFIDGKKMAKDTVYTSSTGTVGYGVNGTATEDVNLYKIKYNDDKNISKLTAETAALGTADAAGAIVSANGYVSDKYIQTSGGAVTTVADNAIFYEVVFETAGNNATGVKEYKAFNGTIYAGMEVWAFDTDTDNAGAEVVIIDKNGVATYTNVTFDITPAAAPAATSGGAVVTCAAVAANGTAPYTFVSAVGAPAGTVVTWAAGVLSVNPAAATATTAGVTVTVTIQDATGNTASDTVTVSVL